MFCEHSRGSLRGAFCTEKTQPSWAFRGHLRVHSRVHFSGCRKRSAAKGVRSLFFRFRDAFGHFSVTFSDASVTFFVTFLPNSFCRTPFAPVCILVSTFVREFVGRISRFACSVLVRFSLNQ